MNDEGSLLSVLATPCRSAWSAQCLPPPRGSPTVLAASACVLCALLQFRLFGVGLKSRCLPMDVQLFWSECDTTSKQTHSPGFSESTGDIGGAGTPLFCLSARRSMARRTESRQFDPPARRARGTTCLRNVPERPCNALQSPAAGLQGRAPPGCLLRPMCGHASGAIGAGGPRSLCAYRPTVLTTTVSS